VAGAPIAQQLAFALLDKHVHRVVSGVHCCGATARVRRRPRPRTARCVPAECIHHCAIDRRASQDRGAQMVPPLVAGELLAGPSDRRSGPRRGGRPRLVAAPAAASRGSPRVHRRRQTLVS
jgi:hypothetical protein